jgi:hypothetical protein
MVASARKHGLLSSFWDKKGPYETRVLQQGRTFKLIDYHMGLKKDPNWGKMVHKKECIRDITTQP